MSMGELTDIFKKVREASRSLVTCGVENINQMMWNLLQFFRRGFGGTDIKSAI